MDAMESEAQEAEPSCACEMEHKEFVKNYLRGRAFVDTTGKTNLRGRAFAEPLEKSDVFKKPEGAPSEAFGEAF